MKLISPENNYKNMDKTHIHIHTHKKIKTKDIREKPRWDLRGEDSEAMRNILRVSSKFSTSIFLRYLWGLVSKQKNDN